jgi:hypothetical protein
MPRGRATATAVRLLDLGYFRIGNDTARTLKTALDRL